MHARRLPPPRSLTGAMLALAMLGCGGTRDLDDEPRDEAASAPGRTSGVPADTTALALWDHLEAAGYREHWAVWPGRRPLDRGPSPHGVMRTTYVNAIAQEALAAGATVLPPGSILVKEHFAVDTLLEAVAVMYKQAGYAPEHGDWFWLKRMGDGAVASHGRVEACIACHAARANEDFIMAMPRPLPPDSIP